MLQPAPFQLKAGKAKWTASTGLNSGFLKHQPSTPPYFYSPPPDGMLDPSRLFFSIL